MKRLDDTQAVIQAGSENDNYQPNVAQQTNSNNDSDSENLSATDVETSEDVLAHNLIADIDSLPVEKLLTIFSFLSRKELLNAGKVSRAWNTLSNDQWLLKEGSNKIVPSDNSKICAVSISKDGKTAIYNTNEKVYVWNLENKRPITILSKPNTNYIFCTISESKKYVATFVKKYIDDKPKTFFQVLNVADKEIIFEKEKSFLETEDSRLAPSVHNMFFIDDEYFAIMFTDTNNSYVSVTYLLLLDINNGFQLDKKLVFDPYDLDSLPKEVLAMISSINFNVSANHRHTDASNLNTILIDIIKNDQHNIKRVENIHISKNQKHLLCSEQYSPQRIFIVDLSNKIAREIPNKINEKLLCISLSKSERYIAISYKTTGIKIYDLVLGNYIKTIELENVFYVSFSDRGLYIATPNCIDLLDFAQLGIDAANEKNLITANQTELGEEGAIQQSTTFDK